MRLACSPAPPLLALAAALGLGLPARANEYSPEAQRVLAAARDATGGQRAWNSLRGWDETGAWGDTRYRLQVDPVRYGVRVELRRGGTSEVQGYNGLGQWEISAVGNATGGVDRFTTAQARSIAFFSAYAFYFPSRFAAKGVHLGVRQHQGRSFDVLRIEPGGGLPRELWFDRRTRLLSRMIDRNGPSPVTWELSDYRKAGAVQAPFRIALDAGDPARAQVRQVEAVTYPVLDRAVFSLARPATTR